ncbi:hypothetical protein [Archaeoglobus sp.]
MEEAIFNKLKLLTKTKDLLEEIPETVNIVTDKEPMNAINESEKEIKEKNKEIRGDLLRRLVMNFKV